jgi:ABC-type multidrug transport system ATPase subunit
VTAYNIGLKSLQFVKSAARDFKDGTRVDILRPMIGVANPGELTVLLGRPGAGCSTFLKAIESQTYGFHFDKNSKNNYSGVTTEEV